MPKHEERDGMDDEVLTQSVLQIRCFPDPVLKKPAEPVECFDAELLDFVERMRATMRMSDGVGLAAPQVGESRRIAIVEYDGRSFVLINPRLLEQRDEQTGEEGCLSFPGIYAEVRRPAWVRVEARDERGELHIHEVEGFLARAFLHEMDHLDGKLFIEYLSPLKRGMIRNKMRKRATAPR
ncbi:MAG: peptide deformylase [Fretibacterium sp.]|nr:peptide deformylase [Fretibacterium sp.]